MPPCNIILHFHNLGIKPSLDIRTCVKFPLQDRQIVRPLESKGDGEKRTRLVETKPESDLLAAAAAAAAEEEEGKAKALAASVESVRGRVLVAIIHSIQTSNIRMIHCFRILKPVSESSGELGLVGVPPSLLPPDELLPPVEPPPPPPQLRP